MEIYRTTTAKDFERYVHECSQGHEGLGIHIATEPCVWTGQLPTINSDVCKEKNLDIGTGNYLGGTIVNMVGDITLCVTTYYISDYAPNLVEGFIQYLSDRGFNAVLDENDVLVDNKKILSWARFTSITGWTQSFIHFSIGKMNLKLIKEICKKPMIKEPGSLSELGITTEDVLIYLNL